MNMMLKKALKMIMKLINGVIKIKSHIYHMNHNKS